MATIENIPVRNFVSRTRQAKKDKFFDAVIIVIFLLFAALTLYPILHIFACSVSGGDYVIKGQVHILPNHFSFENYKLLSERTFIVNSIGVTLARTLIGTVTCLASSALLAYILSRKDFLFKKSLSLFWAIAMFASAGLIPTLTLYRYINLKDTFWVYIIPNLVSIFNVMIMRTYMKGIPESLEEAAQMEGAGYMTVFFKIVCPLCKPVYAATALFLATYHWNAWFDAMIYNRMCPKYSTLQYEMMKLITSIMHCHGTVESFKARISVMGIKCAVAVISILPHMIIYPFLQKHFICGVTFKGVKE